MVLKREGREGVSYGSLVWKGVKYEDKEGEEAR